jgi:hypothetical protein
LGPAGGTGEVATGQAIIWPSHPRVNSSVEKLRFVLLRL